LATTLNLLAADNKTTSGRVDYNKSVPAACRKDEGDAVET